MDSESREGWSGGMIPNGGKGDYYYAFRSQAEIQEATLDSSNVSMAHLEREMRYLVKEVEGLRETAERVKGLERDNKELSKQAAIDLRTLATLREVREPSLWLSMLNECFRLPEHNNLPSLEPK